MLLRWVHGTLATSCCLQLEGKDTTSAIDVLVREVQKTLAGLMSTLTWIAA